MRINFRIKLTLSLINQLLLLGHSARHYCVKTRIELFQCFLLSQFNLLVSLRSNRGNQAEHFSKVRKETLFECHREQVFGCLIISLSDAYIGSVARMCSFPTASVRR